MRVPRQTVALASIVLVAIFSATNASAQVLWLASSGDWSLASNWSTGVLPTAVDLAYLNNGGTISISQMSPTCGTLQVDSGSVLMTGGGLASNQVYVGDTGSGSFSQSGGTHNVASEIDIGVNLGSSGLYTLSGNALLTAPNEAVGLGGNGVLNQSGGTNATTNLYVGYQAGGNGTYTLGGNVLLSASSEYIGYGGIGTFTQSSGTNAAGYVDVSNGGQGSGLYTFQNGLLRIGAGLRTVGGTFDFSGGSGQIVAGNSTIVDLTGSITNTASASVTIGTNSLLIVPTGFNPSSYHSFTSSAMLHTSGTTLNLVSGQGFGGAGTITDPVVCQGTITATAGFGINLYGGLALSNSGQVDLGAGYLIVNDLVSSSMSGGSLTAAALLVASPAMGSFTQSGGVISAGYEAVGNQGAGSIAQSGGSHSISNELDIGAFANSNGSYTLSGNGSLSAPYEEVGYYGTGSFTQLGGTHAISGELNVGLYGNNNDTYALSAGTLATPQEVVGFYGAGNFTQSGGNHSVSSVLVLGYIAGSNGTYNLSDGQLTLGDPANFGSADEFVGYDGTGSFTQSGGNHSVTDAVVLGYLPGSNGTFSLSGGQLNLGFPGIIGLGGLEFIGYGGTGAFMQTGGTHSIVTELDLGFGTGSSGTYNLSDGQLNTNYEYVGAGGTGIFTQTGGTHSVSQSLTLGLQAGSSGTYNLNGGLLVLAGDGLTGGAGAASFNFNGGTLAAGSTWSSSMPIDLATFGASGTFDASGNTLTLAGAISGPGGLMEVGNGRLVLSGTNTFSGGTVVSSGTLTLNGASSLLAGSSLVIGSVASPGAVFNAPTIRNGRALGQPLAPVPEPGTFFLVSIAIVAGAGLWRRLGKSI